MTNTRPAHAQIAKLLNIPPHTIMIVKLNDNHIEITTTEFKKFTLPLPLPTNAQAAAPEPHVTTATKDEN